MSEKFPLFAPYNNRILINIQDTSHHTSSASSGFWKLILVKILPDIIMHRTLLQIDKWLIGSEGLKFIWKYKIKLVLEPFRAMGYQISNILKIDLVW